MKVIVRCAGGGNRWGNFKDVPKHLVKLCGEPLLERTVRLTNEFAPEADVRVVVPDLRDRRYMVSGSTRSSDKPNPDMGDVDKVASSLHLWDDEDRTVVLFGDVWWEEADLRSILCDPIDGWAAWMRIVGDGGEIFGFAFAPEVLSLVEDACLAVADAHEQGRMDAIPGGWALYRTLCGADVADHGDHGHSMPVGAWTADMDTAEDWREFCHRWARTDPSERPPKWVPDGAA